MNKLALAVLAGLGLAGAGYYYTSKKDDLTEESKQGNNDDSNAKDVPEGEGDNKNDDKQ